MGNPQMQRPKTQSKSKEVAAMTDVIRDVFKTYEKPEKPSMMDNIFEEEGNIPEDGMFSFNNLPGFQPGADEEEERAQKD